MIFEFVPRSEWGASTTTETYIRNRRKRSRSAITTAMAHHTAAIDNDTTPNLWTFDTAARYMRALQTVRPELGPLPYCDNAALSEDGSTVWWFEGRGLDAVPAHATGHNTTGYGFGWLGNFNANTTQVMHAQMIAAMEWRLTDLRANHHLVNLGSLLSPQGWQVWGHRDAANKDCPGHRLYPLLEHVNYLGDDMDPRITDNQAETLRQIDASLRSVNSSGAFAAFAVAMIREFRGHTFDSLEESADIDNLDAELHALAAKVASLQPANPDAIVARVLAELVERLKP